MALTPEQEVITKLKVREEIARRKLAIAKKPMNDAVRVATAEAFASVKAKYAGTLAPFIEEVNNVEAQMKELCK